MILQIFSDETALASGAASAIAARLRAEPTTVLGLPTGRTPIAVYARLVERTRAGQIDWSATRTFNLDEFVGLPADHAGSYRAFMSRHLFGHLNIDPARVHFPDGMAVDIEAECQRYDAAIRAAGGIGLQVLGIGANGHIGFNEPADQLDARTHRVTLHQGTRAANADWFGGDPALVPAEALSVGMASIMTARDVLLLAMGAGKADAVAAMIEGPITTRVPASILQMHPAVVAMIDRAAASKLTRPAVARGELAGRRAGP